MPLASVSINICDAATRAAKAALSFKDTQPISELRGWHTEKPSEDCTVLLYTETQFHKNAQYVIAEWDNHAQCFYDEADDEPISEWTKWKKL